MSFIFSVRVRKQEFSTIKDTLRLYFLFGNQLLLCRFGQAYLDNFVISWKFSNDLNVYPILGAEDGVAAV